MTHAVLFVRFLGAVTLAAILFFTPWPWSILPYSPFVGGLLAYGLSRLLPPDEPDHRAVAAERAWCHGVMEAAKPSSPAPACDKLVA